MLYHYLINEISVLKKKHSILETNNIQTVFHFQLIDLYLKCFISIVLTCFLSNLNPKFSFTMAIQQKPVLEHFRLPQFCVDKHQLNLKLYLLCKYSRMNFGADTLLNTLFCNNLHFCMSAFTRQCDLTL